MKCHVDIEAEVNIDLKKDREGFSKQDFINIANDLNIMESEAIQIFNMIRRNGEIYQTGIYGEPLYKNVHGFYHERSWIVGFLVGMSYNKEEGDKIIPIDEDWKVADDEDIPEM